MAFEKMCRVWALGSRDFKKDLLKSEGLLKDGDFIWAYRTRSPSMSKPWNPRKTSPLKIMSSLLQDLRNDPFFSH